MVTGEDRNTFDLNFHARHKLHERLEFVGGLGYQVTADSQDSAWAFWYRDMKRTDDLYSAFLQGTVTLVKRRLSLTFGSKFEENDYTGFEYQPSIRMFWKPGSTNALWASVSRAVHTPSRWRSDAITYWATIPPGTPSNPGPLPLMLTFVGNEDIESEELVAYELGYRVQPRHNVSFDMAAYYNVYKGLNSLEIGAPYLDLATSAFMVLPTTYVNAVDGESYGGELTLDWWPQQGLRWQAAYSLLQMRFDDPSVSIGDQNPKHQAWLRMSADPGKSLGLDMTVRYVDDIPAYNLNNYFTLDARLGWAFYDSWELTLAGQNLLESTHSEYITSSSSRMSLVERSGYLRLDWRF